MEEFYQLVSALKRCMLSNNHQGKMLIQAHEVNNSDTDKEIRERIRAMGTRIAPVTQKIPMDYGTAFGDNQLAPMFMALRGMPIQGAQARAEKAASKIRHDRIEILGGLPYCDFTYLDQQIAIAQHMKAPILIVNRILMISSGIIS